MSSGFGMFRSQNGVNRLSVWIGSQLQSEARLGEAGERRGGCGKEIRCAAGADVDVHSVDAMQE